MSDKALQLLQQSNAAVRAGDDEAALKAWRELWIPMQSHVPWDAPKKEERLP